MLSEKRIEMHLIRECKKRGWHCLKLVDVGRAGYPDRQIMQPDGAMWLCEVKRQDGKLSKIQIHRIKQLRNLGFTVHVVYSKDDIDEVLKSC